MTIMIPIDRASVKKNPNAGQTVYQLYLGSETRKVEVKDGVKRTWIINKNSDAFLIQEEQCNEPDYIEVEHKEKYDTIQSLTAEPAYLYTYVDSDLTCYNCKAVFKYSELEYDEILRDTWSDRICPNCHVWDCVDVQFENFDKEKHVQ